LHRRPRPSGRHRLARDDAEPGRIGLGRRGHGAPVGLGQGPSRGRHRRARLDRDPLAGEALPDRRRSGRRRAGPDRDADPRRRSCGGRVQRGDEGGGDRRLDALALGRGHPEGAGRPADGPAGRRLGRSDRGPGAPGRCGGHARGLPRGLRRLRPLRLDRHPLHERAVEGRASAGTDGARRRGHGPRLQQHRHGRRARPDGGRPARRGRRPGHHAGDQILRRRRPGLARCQAVRALFGSPGHHRPDADLARGGHAPVSGGAAHRRPDRHPRHRRPGQPRRRRLPRHRRPAFRRRPPGRRAAGRRLRLAYAGGSGRDRGRRLGRAGRARRSADRVLRRRGAPRSERLPGPRLAPERSGRSGDGAEDVHPVARLRQLPRGRAGHHRGGQARRLHRLRHRPDDRPRRRHPQGPGRADGRGRADRPPGGLRGLADRAETRPFSLRGGAASVKPRP
uniref:Acetyl-CoA C-acetyltransferase n=1 Tax=Parastrongyloides trichosuri TaxID=131310 RepID=A0A0N5A031_PARTI